MDSVSETTVLIENQNESTEETSCLFEFVPSFIIGMTTLMLGPFIYASYGDYPWERGIIQSALAGMFFTFFILEASVMILFPNGSYVIYWILAFIVTSILLVVSAAAAIKAKNSCLLQRRS